MWHLRSLLSAHLHLQSPIERRACLVPRAPQSNTCCWNFIRHGSSRVRATCYFLVSTIGPYRYIRVEAVRVVLTDKLTMLVPRRCPHCQHFAPDFERIACSLNSTSVLFTRVNCAVYPQPPPLPHHPSCFDQLTGRTVMAHQKYTSTAD